MAKTRYGRSMKTKEIVKSQERLKKVERKLERRRKQFKHPENYKVIGKTLQNIARFK
jgi:hypothetical protein